MAAAVLATALFQPAGAEAGGALNVRYLEGRLTAHFQQVPLGAVLTELHRQTGMQVVVHDVRVNTQPVSGQFAAVPLAQGVQKILHAYSHLIHADAATGKMRVILFANSTPSAAEAAPTSIAGSDDYPALAEGAPADSGTLQAQLLTARHEVDPARRAQAVESVWQQTGGQADTDPAILQALKEFTVDNDPDVRIAAHQALADLQRFNELSAVN